MNRNEARLLAALLLAASAAPALAAPLARPVTPVKTGLALPLAAAPALTATHAAPLAPALLSVPLAAPSVLSAPNDAPEAPKGPAAAAARVEGATDALNAAVGDGQVDKGGASAHEAGAAAERALTGETPGAAVAADAAPSFEEQVKERSAFVDKFREQFAGAIIGQTDLRESLLLGVLSGGNILLEGVPGVAKTRAVKTVAAMLGLTSGRIQFTRDLMPAEITGQMEKDQKTGEWRFVRGPIFVDMLLADEINRAKGQTQSGMLQGMEEKAVTVAGERHPLSRLFFVVATQNPIEEDGVYPLPKAQYDRFMFKVDVPNPSAEELSRIVRLKLEEGDEPAVQEVLTRDQLLEARALVRKIKVSEEVTDYIGRLVEATHKDKSPVAAVKKAVRQGASPRAAEWLARAAQALAFVNHRHYVEIEDVQKVARRVLRHRILLEYDVDASVTTDSLIDLLANGGVPVTVKKP